LAQGGGLSLTCSSRPLLCRHKKQTVTNFGKISLSPHIEHHLPLFLGETVWVSQRFDQSELSPLDKKACGRRSASELTIESRQLEKLGCTMEIVRMPLIAAPSSCRGRRPRSDGWHSQSAIIRCGKIYSGSSREEWDRAWLSFWAITEVLGGWGRTKHVQHV